MITLPSCAGNCGQDSRNCTHKERCRVHLHRETAEVEGYYAPWPLPQRWLVICAGAVGAVWIVVHLFGMGVV